MYISTYIIKYTTIPSRKPDGEKEESQYHTGQLNGSYYYYFIT